MSQRRLDENDIDYLFDEAGRRMETPTIYDIEALLAKLTPRYRADVFWTRHHLKWFFKKCYKQFGIEMPNPYWRPRR